MTNLVLPESRSLAAELSYTPAALRQAHLERLAALIPDLDPERPYTYGDVFRRVTQFSTDANADVLLPGSVLQRDLGLILRDLTRRVPLDGTDPDNPVLAADEVLSRYRIARRTLRRWALQGLPLAFYRMGSGGVGWGVRRAALERFMEVRRVRASVSCTRLSEPERRAILERVAVLRREGGRSTSELIRQVARDTGRSPATIRRLLRRCAEVPRRVGRGLPSVQRDALVERYRGGTPVRELARLFGRSPSTVYRILHQALLNEVLSLRIHYVPNPAFSAPDADSVCLGRDGLFTFPPEPEEETDVPAGLPPYVAELYRIPVLDRDEERHLFRKYNYIKYKMALLQEQVRRRGYSAGLLEAFQEYRRAADQVRLVLIRCNLRLVVSVARRHAGPLMNLMDLVSEGNVCLMRAVDSYDCTHRARFATYATWALTKHFARIVPEENYRLHAFVTGEPEVLERAAAARVEDPERAEVLTHLRAVLRAATQRLSQREREIIEAHYGTDGRPARTLEEIGRLFGLTRERIRQIEVRALGKLRGLIAPDILDAVT